ncbi:MAG: hypothetical protein LBV61_05830 [Burkholderiaceae bacterium]|jgi:hypothetical protein|nr:hypothetical protein [Burkholderiaceae bacterium]
MRTRTTGLGRLISAFHDDTKEEKTQKRFLGKLLIIAKISVPYEHGPPITRTSGATLAHKPKRARARGREFGRSGQAAQTTQTHPIPREALCTYRRERAVFWRQGCAGPIRSHLLNTSASSGRKTFKKDRETPQQRTAALRQTMWTRS